MLDGSITDKPIVYLVNQYPKVSHSFIRREINALERLDVPIERVSLRRVSEDLVDPNDISEAEKTSYILEAGVWALLLNVVIAAMRTPRTFWQAVVEMRRFNKLSKRKAWIHCAYLVEACWLANRMRRIGARHLHAHFGTNPAEVAVYANILSGVPYSVTIHGYDEFDHPVALGLQRKMERAAFVVAISAFTRSQLMRWSRSDDWAKTAVVHCGLDAEFYEHKDQTLQVPRRLVCVGRICKDKAQLFLLDAAAKLIRSGMELELVFAGDGEQRQELERKIDQLGLRANVTVTGWLSSQDVRSAMLSARALVHPSFADGLPVVVMEAMALRRPVVTCYISGTPELVVDGVTGWLVPAGSTDQLAEAMKRCLETPDHVCDRMGTDARRRVLERHNVDTEARKLAALFGVAVVDASPASTFGGAPAG